MLQLGMSRRLKDGRYWIQAINRFYNAATDEEKLTAAASLREIRRQIDEGLEGGMMLCFVDEIVHC
jgi:hypothetical protein